MADMKNMERCINAMQLLQISE